MPYHYKSKISDFRLKISKKYRHKIRYLLLSTLMVLGQHGINKAMIMGRF